MPLGVREADPTSGVLRVESRHVVTIEPSAAERCRPCIERGREADGTRRLLAALAPGITAWRSLRSPARAANVVALRLPADTTVDPEGERRLLSIGPDGTVAALAQSMDSMVPESVVLRWNLDRALECTADDMRDVSRFGRVDVAIDSERDLVHRREHLGEHG